MRKVRSTRRHSIFRALFVPLFLIMILQALIFYFAAVYGGIEESLSQNAADILTERLANRKNEIETRFNTRWSALSSCAASLDTAYETYAARYGDRVFVGNAKLQIQYLRENAPLLIDTLRHNQVNGVFLILNDRADARDFDAANGEDKYGLCIRDMDQESNYTGTEDLLLERAPSSIVDALGCSLDSWWEPRYVFKNREAGDFYYEPLDAAWTHTGARGVDLAYCSGAHHLSGSDPAVLSYSIPLIAKDGYPYGVLGVEISVRYLSSLLPSRELIEADAGCYVMTIENAGTQTCAPIVGTGALYTRCFGDNRLLSISDAAPTGGFTLTGRGDIALYGDSARLSVYNNNNPFENRTLTLLAIVEENVLFAYIERIKLTLMSVSLISLVLGVVGILWVSRRFAAPITALAHRVRGMKPQTDYELGRLGIEEIDQLVDSIEELNRNVGKDIARTEFFSRMSHDMRTPMNAIISFSSREMLQGATRAEKDDYLEKIHTSGVYLLALINEVLDMTKIESNKTDLHYVTLPADALCRATIPIIEKLAQGKGVNFTWTVQAEPGRYVLADEQHINQIVMNLLSNAVKFTPEGGLIRLGLLVEDDPAHAEKALLTIRVADTGIGMSEAFLKSLYTPFEQEHRGQEGTGLGLSIAKRLAELMGGGIDCQSMLGEGTTFTVTIPLRAGDPANAAAPTEQAKACECALPGKRVLVCEDNGINQQIVQKLLKMKGMQTVIAANGEEGLAAFEASAPGAFDAILMDIRMPVMDGLEAARRIRALPRPDAQSVPIIAMTANAFAEDVDASGKAGMNAHLAKPVEPQKLYETLARYLSGENAKNREDEP